MKRIITAVFVMLAVVISLVGCSQNVVEVEVLLKNSTGYELQTVSFQIPPTSGTTSPMHDLVTPDDKPLQPGEERETSTSIFERDLGNEGWPVIFVLGDETKYDGGSAISLEKGTNSFEITCDDDMNFTVTRI